MKPKLNRSLWVRVAVFPVMNVVNKNTKNAPIAWLPNTRPISIKGLTPNGAARNLSNQLITAQFCGEGCGDHSTASFYLFAHFFSFIRSPRA